MVHMVMTYRLRDDATRWRTGLCRRWLDARCCCCCCLLYVQLLLLVDGQIAVVPVRLFQCMYVCLCLGWIGTLVDGTRQSVRVSGWQ